MATEAFFDATTAWHVEFDKAPSRILESRWPGVPNYGDITAVDWSQVEPVDILTGGFPCQDLSLAGRRQGMRPGTRSGLWADFVKAIDVLQPAAVVIENVRGLLSGCAEGGRNGDGSEMEPCQGCLGDGEHRPVLRALGRVLGDLADLGFDAEWAGIRASDVGAPHGRFRVFVLAYRPGVGREWAGIARDGRGGPADGGVATVTNLFPTPTTEPETGNGHARYLGREVRELFPSPRASEGEKGGPNMRGSKGDLMLSSAVTHLLPTPQVANADGGHASRSGARSDELLLPGAAAQVQRIGWGQYEPAVRRWEAITRPAPAPTLPDGRDGNHRLNAAFAEWMMGVPAGWITDVGLTRREALKAAGNGVVPQQAYAALDGMWPRLEGAAA